MIPAAISRQLEKGLADYLRFSFWSSTPGMERVVEHLLEDPGMLFKGPYVGLQLPFRSSGDPRYFPHVPLDFQPHRHQEQVFARLGGRRKECTLLATGTGSGKTESFLVPILDHCLAEAHRPGVKAILIYPMNALATDQAGRIAGLIHRNDRLRGRVSAGLYIGQPPRRGSGARGRGAPRGETTMGESHIITDRATLQQAPPSILLTNYKMLDYLLLRARDQGIWQHNIKGTLRFLVVDEIHTFDGAQGTDLACLLRRLKRRLDVDDGSLCCVGTSATLGGQGAGEELRAYAKRVFGESFDKHSVIGESRLSVEEFLHGHGLEETHEPGSDDKPILDPTRAIDPETWIADQERLWFGLSAGELADGVPESGDDDERDEDRQAVALARRLRCHGTFQALLRMLGGRPVAFGRLVEQGARSRREWRDDPELGPLVLTSLLALVSRARSWRDELPEVAERRRAAGRSRPVRPFLDTRFQLWQRELRRMVATVGSDPRLRHSTDLDHEALQRHLPMVHCRECGSLGWAALVPRDRPHLYRTGQDLTAFYRAYFGKDTRVSFLYPIAAWPEDHPERQLAFELDCQSLTRVGEHDQPEGEVIQVIDAARRRSGSRRQELSRDCPFCHARDALTLVGFRAATLTSVHIDQLFASAFNDDKKLLTFSDSVQDAAHRAGFFGARTWRTNLRIAMLRTLEALGEPSLAELADTLGPWWRERMESEAWVATFLAPNMAWLHDWSALVETGALPPGSDLPTLVDRRLAFEVVAEFGLQAAIGRSLGRTGAACARLDGERFDAAIEHLVEPVRNEVPGLRGVAPEALAHFVLGLLHHLRSRGGILARSLPQTYLDTCGRDTHSFKRDPALPSFGATSRLPALLTDRKSARFETWGAGTTAGRGRGSENASWYRRWADTCFGGGPGLVADAGSFYAVVLPVLVAHGLLGEHFGRKGEPVWGVAEEALRLTPRTTAVICDHGACRHRVTVAEDEASRWLGMPCLTLRCQGGYVPVAGSEASDEGGGARGRDYFGRLYAHGDLQRIFTHEHTGLLERGARERVEIEFKAAEGPADDPLARRPWYPNLLSCTPTLEMGIDIGDLSSAVLCSVPPGQANYLQRIGRAGRRDGNAFLLTVAGSRPHDLYFFADPEQMLAGEVPPPGVFLDAPAVLERQLTAFCMDRWVSLHGLEAELPPQLRSVLGNLGEADEGRFPGSFLAFVRRHQPTLLREFGEMFGDEVSGDTSEHLRLFMEGGDDGKHSLESALLDALQRERRQRDSLSSKAQALRQQLKQLRASEARNEDHEEQIEAREAEKEALLELVKGINRRRTLEFLTDVGLLPNYAFPESAVRLRSVIWRRKKVVPAEGSAYETWSYEYNRSPSSALSELAPGADFFATGRRVRIDEVDLTSSEVETWRFCPECSHAQNIDIGDEADACPACGHTGWRDSGQKQRLLELQQVFANTPDRESRIRDEQDDRQPRFFEREMLVAIDPRSPSQAWRFDDTAFPFGFEYLGRATFRDVNFGEPNDQGSRTTIAGREAVRPGFEVCLRCGKVQRPGRPAEHNLSCPSRRGEAQEQIEPCLYLYRQLSSEALRLLLPLTEIGTQRQVHSFIAALQLGLKHYFAGSIDHIRTTLASDPVPGTVLRRQYLVLYDTVPGGTGYLRQLVTPPEGSDALPLFEAMERAIEHLESCACWHDPDPTKDGCYRCLYAYRNSQDMSDTSARQASELLRRILAGREKLGEVEKLGDVSVSALLDSALEAYFLEALRRIEDGEGRQASLRRKVIGSKTGWLWTLGEARWEIEPQVEPPVSETGGVGVSIDFVMRPARADSDRRLAIFLDGWEFHRRRIGQDLRQRMALAASGRWDPWTFTWQDLHGRLVSQGRGARDVVPELAVAEPGALREVLQKAGQNDYQGLADEALFDWLVRELVDEQGLPWRFLGGAILAARMEPALPSHQRAWADLVGRAAPAEARERLAALEVQLVTQGASGEDHPPFELMAIRGGSRSVVLCLLDDSPEQLEALGMRGLWQGYLRLFQWLRQTDEPWFLTTQGLADGLDFGPLVQLRGGEPAERPRWAGFDSLEEEYRGLAEMLMAAGVGEPEIGLEIPNMRGETWSEGEMVWEERRLAITSRLEVREALGSPDSRWTLYYLEDLPCDGEGAAVAALVSALLVETVEEES